MNADFADKKRRKSAFLCVNQRPKLISDNVYYIFDKDNILQVRFESQLARISSEV